MEDNDIDNFVSESNKENLNKISSVNDFVLVRFKYPKNKDKYYIVGNQTVKEKFFLSKCNRWEPSQHKWHNNEVPTSKWS